jgi:hypothetical protein
MCSEKNAGQNHNIKTTISPPNTWQNKNTCNDKTNNNDMFGETYSEQIKFAESLLPLVVCYLKKTQNYEIILPIALFGCETWSVTLKEENRLKVFENWEMRKLELSGMM